MTYYFNLHRVGWKSTRMIRINIPDMPSAVAFWQFVAALLALGYFMLSVSYADMRNIMADELVRARIKATEYELDVICLLRPECSLRSWGSDGQYHVVTVRRGEVEHYEVKP